MNMPTDSLDFSADGVFEINSSNIGAEPCSCALQNMDPIDGSLLGHAPIRATRDNR